MKPSQWGQFSPSFLGRLDDGDRLRCAAADVECQPQISRVQQSIAAFR
jgi:hypothetical protein